MAQPGSETVVPKGRVIRQCGECSRRKKRCNKQVPCEGPSASPPLPVIIALTPLSQAAFNEAYLTCVVWRPTRRKKSKLDPEDCKLPGLEGPELASFALSELRAVRDGYDSFRTRITRLESILSKVIGNASLPSDLSLNAFEMPKLEPYGVARPDLLYGQGLSGMEVGGASAFVRSNGGASGYQPDSGGVVTHAEAAELEAGIALEFMALGRQRNLTGETPHSSILNSLPSSTALPVASQPQLQATSSDYGTPASLALAAPGTAVARIIISHSIDSLNWLICGVVYPPKFQVEVDNFWDSGESAFETTSPLWLALYFALLCCGVSQLTRDKRVVLGLREDDLKRLGKTWFRCVMACLYRGRFIEEHSIVTLQAICALALGARDAWSSSTIATLLSTGLSIAQDLNLHHMPSDAAWAAASIHLSAGDRASSLIAREISKRCFWALIREDWFAIPYRRSYALRPSQITSPLPLNIRNWDLEAGIENNQPPEIFTVVSFLLHKVRLASFVQAVFENMDNGADSFDFVQNVGVQLERFVREAPPWLQRGTPLDGMPPFSDWLRSVFFISTRHKLVTLYRPFFHRALTNSRFADMRRQSIEAARITLREAPNIGECRVWTVLYHISASCFVICLGLFQSGHGLDEESEAQRREVHAAVEVLRVASASSDIASRGVQLISKLLADEAVEREARRRTSVEEEDRPHKRPRNDADREWWEVSQSDEGAVGDDRMLSSLFLLPRKADQDPLSLFPDFGLTDDPFSTFTDLDMDFGTLG